MIKPLRPRVLIIGVTIAVVFIAIGVVFTQLDLGIGDQVASIGSFIVSIASLMVSVVAAWRPPKEQLTVSLGEMRVQVNNPKVSQVGQTNYQVSTHYYGVQPDTQHHR
jgi:hypothetical protein